MYVSVYGDSRLITPTGACLAYALECHITWCGVMHECERLPGSHCDCTGLYCAAMGLWLQPELPFCRPRPGPGSPLNSLSACIHPIKMLGSDNIVFFYLARAHKPYTRFSNSCSWSAMSNTLKRVTGFSGIQGPILWLLHDAVEFRVVIDR